MTERLYYEDSHRTTFQAKVVSCDWDEKKEGYAVVLDRTVFFPEGGGQYADTGVLDGKEVFDVRERDEKIFHYMKEPLESGREVEGKIDYPERFSKMQQHTGEHIVSGLVHQQWGYDNVGFHLGKELVTMDFNGILTGEQLREIEQKANEAVAANIAIQVTYPSKEQLDSMDYRSKKELSGQIRIVTVPGYDVCACCAPHVERTGEIGMIKLIDGAKYKGGTRVTMVCGFRALADYNMREDNVRAISQMLSVKPQETADGVRHLQGEVQQWKDKLIRTQTRYLESKLAEVGEGADHIILFEEDLDKNVVRRFVDSGMHHCKGICGVLLGSREKGYQYTLGSEHVDLKAISGKFHQMFPGKGGGKSQMIQGTIQPGSEQEDIANALCHKLV